MLDRRGCHDARSYHRLAVDFIRRLRDAETDSRRRNTACGRRGKARWSFLGVGGPYQGHPEHNRRHAADCSVRQMFQHRVKRLPVVDSGNRLVGIVSRSDILRVFLRSDLSIRDEVRSLTSRVGNGGVRPEVKDGVVILRGKMRPESFTEALARLVGVLPGVVGVRNEVKVGVGDD